MDTLYSFLQVVISLLGAWKTFEWAYGKVYTYFREKIELDITLKISSHPDFDLLSRMYDLRKKDREVRLSAINEIIKDSDTYAKK